jgi:uncharacterized protein (DUF2345 family)
MEGYTQGLESSSDTKQQEQGKIFRQALMLLASPNGIALTTPENIILQASQDIAESASGSINLSAQKNIIGHAQDKISLFAAQKGLRAYAAKGKLELQAQDDAIEAIARKVIKIISTEDKIELSSAKEIDIKAGGSQLIVNGNGVFIKTGGKFESKAGQHIFLGGENFSIPKYDLPKIEKNRFSLRFAPFGNDINFDLMGFINQPYKIINKESGEILSSGIITGKKLPRVFSDSEDEVELSISEESWKLDVQALSPSEEKNFEDEVEDVENLYCEFDDDNTEHGFLDSDLINSIINK